MTDLELIAKPAVWPYHPFLPMKRHVRLPTHEDMVCGVIVARRPNVVYEVNFMDATVEALASAHKYEYASVEEMLADGWRVD